MSEYILQAENFCKNTGTKISITFKSYGQMLWDEDTNNYRNIYTVKFKRENKSFSVTFGDSIMNTNNGLKPSKYDVLSCLQKWDCGTFEDFCKEYGCEMYDDDYMGYNKKSMRTYKACKNEYRKVENMWGDCMEELREIT